MTTVLTWTWTSNRSVFMTVSHLGVCYFIWSALHCEYYLTVVKGLLKYGGMLCVTLYIIVLTVNWVFTVFALYLGPPNINNYVICFGPYTDLIAMTLSWVFIIHGLFIISSCSTYLFIAPRTIRPGHDLTIQGSLLTTPQFPVTVQATLEKSTEPERRFGFRLQEKILSTTPAPVEPFSSVIATFSNTEPQTFSLPVNHSLVTSGFEIMLMKHGVILFDLFASKLYNRYYV